MKISACMLTRTELSFIRNSIPALREVADEIVVVDTGSTDQTADWLTREGIEVIRLRPKVVVEKGYAYLRNLGASKLTGDWIYQVDADEMLDPSDRKLVRGVLEQAQTPSVWLRVATFRFNRRKNPEDWMDIARNVPFEPGGHVRFYRRDAGVEWRGYIHEELWQGDTRQFDVALRSNLRHLHFTNYRTWGDPNHKALRVGYMMYRAYTDREYGKWMNPWWFQNWYPKHLPICQRQAEEYRRMAHVIDPD